MGSKFVHLQCVDDLLSFAVEAPAQAQAASKLLRSSGQWLDVVPGMDSVVVRFDAVKLDQETATRLLRDALADGIPPLKTKNDAIEIPVVYGGAFGPDLDDLCERLGLTEDEVIALHSGGEYCVELLGFTPGFAFVGGLDERLQVPRRSEPRQRVAAGSIGIADAYTGMYALASPGGWTLIGRTPFPLFDADAEEPFVLEPGRSVRFKAVSAKEAGFEP
jgi:KipI family sensor histidine kinase inhibitor